MGLDGNHTEALRCFHYHEFDVRPDNRMPKSSKNPPDTSSPTATIVIGRSDFHASKYGLAVNIELKYGQRDFDISMWRPHQRIWADEYSLSYPYQTPYYIFLTVGTGRPSAKPLDELDLSKRPRKSWLIPYQDMINVIDKVSVYSQTVPYALYPNSKNEMKENNFDLVHLFKNYELQWLKIVGWVIPQHHQFYPRVDGSIWQVLFETYTQKGELINEK